MEPIRARPVPFCFHNFLPEPETSWRVFVAAVPDRLAAVYCRTASYNSASLISAPNTASESSIEPTAALFRSTISTFGIALNPSRPLSLCSPNHDVSTVGSGNRAPDGDDVVIWIDAHDLKIAHSYLLRSHAPGHFHPGPTT